MFVRDEQREKADTPKDSNWSGKLISVRLPHQLKACDFIEERVVGQWTLVNFVQPLKAALPIVCRLCDSTIPVSSVQLRKALLASRVMGFPSCGLTDGITTLPRGFSAAAAASYSAPFSMGRKIQFCDGLDVYSIGCDQEESR